MLLHRTTLKSGPGIPLVFLHGFLGTGADWIPVCSKLPPCCCIAYDLPGHGKSPFSKSISLDLPFFHLIGYSMGGRLAIQIARENPQQIASLTLLSTHPGLTTAEEKRKRMESDQEWAELLFKLPIDDFLIRWYDQPLFYPFKPDFSLRRKQNIPELAQAFLHYSLAHQSYYPIDEMLVGERDKKFASLASHPIFIPNAAHAIHLENPQAVAKTLQQKLFL